MTTRRFSKGTKDVTRERTKPRVYQFGRLLPGDQWQQIVPGRKTRQPVRFVDAEVNAEGEVIAVGVITLLNNHLRYLAPESIEMPGQRRLNAQRAAKAADKKESA